MENQSLDVTDKKILDIIQSDFPLHRRPYAILGKECGISEEEAFRRVGKMRKQGLIRRLGANFQSSGLGFVSTLCACKVKPEHLEEFISLVNAIPGVTHNYERDHEWNIWFTLISESSEKRDDIIENLRKKTGVEILNLPASRLFKIKVDFPMSD